VKHKIMRAMSEREESRKLQGFVQIDDAYLGGERHGGQPGRGSENKPPFVIAVQTDEHHQHPAFTVITRLRQCLARELDHAAPGARMRGLYRRPACLRWLEDAGHAHTTLDTGGGRTATQQRGAHWVNVVLANLKRAISGVYYAIRQANTRCVIGLRPPIASTAGSACATDCRDLPPP
jgi:hypothetical protein